MIVVMTGREYVYVSECVGEWLRVSRSVSACLPYTHKSLSCRLFLSNAQIALRLSFSLRLPALAPFLAPSLPTPPPPALSFSLSLFVTAPPLLFIYNRSK